VLVSFFLLGPQIGVGEKRGSSLSDCYSVQPVDGTSSLLTAYEEPGSCGGFEIGSITIFLLVI